MFGMTGEDIAPMAGEAIAGAAMAGAPIPDMLPIPVDMPMPPPEAAPIPDWPQGLLPLASGQHPSGQHSYTVLLPLWLLTLHCMPRAIFWRSSWPEAFPDPIPELKPEPPM